MDKLRALEYFVAAAHAHSLSGAARELEVSVPAVAKLVSSLERSLGVRLFERKAQGLALTASGEAYLEACRPLLEQLREVDEQISASITRARGEIVVGVQPVLAQRCLAPALPHWHAQYPDIRVDVRDFTRFTDEQMDGVDVFLVLGWPQRDDLVHRRIATGRFRVCAAPQYWAARGMPEHPRDLVNHDCVLFRNVDGIVMDLWTFARGEERASITAKPWLVTSNESRETAIAAVRAGGGVGRFIDFADDHDLHTGALVPALTDWEVTEVPPVNLLYRPSVRRIPRVRLFLEFVVSVFGDIEAARDRRRPATGRPDWLRSRYRRSSGMLAGGRSGD